MKRLNHLIWAAAAVLVAAAVLPTAVPSLVTLLVVGTGCLVVIEITRHYIGRR
ncbi:MAG TPA: hypothetical protein VGC79_14045 [Polyangiaceae bacterium]